MTERDIFLNALEREDPAARAAYLDAACAGQPALRRRVEELLRYHRENTTFLNEPAMEQLAAAEESLAFLGAPAEPGSLGRLDRYEVLEVVGRGGMGVVLKAHDTKLQRVVAVKLLARQLAASDTARRRFVREAQAAAAVRDDHVVAIYEVHDGGPRPYLVMEFVAGVTLEDVIRRGAPPELREVLRIGSQVARGLAAAHAQGLVHSDVKPANILLENGVQRVRITDFGLARAAADPTDRGLIAGTPLYMSPEQARGEPTDHRSDLFSFGSVLYALCTGRPPFPGDATAEVLRRVCEDRPRPIRESHPNVPDWLCSLISKLHAKEAAARFGTAQEVADLLGHQLALAQQPSPAPRRRRWWWFGAALVSVVLAAALAGLAARAKWWNRPETNEPPAEAAPFGYTGPVASLDLRREDIPPMLLALAGGGDPAKAPPELAAVLGDGPFLLPRAGSQSWMEQSPDGKVLAVPLDEDVVLFATPTGEYLRTLKGPGGRVVGVSFTQDSRLLAAKTLKAAGNGATRVWDLQANQQLYTNELPDSTSSAAVVFSPDGKCLISIGSNRIHVWDARTGKEVQTLGQPGGLATMNFSPDGRRLAGADFRGRCVKVFDWDGAKLTEVRSLEGHQAPVVAVAYSPDGRWLASGGEDRTVVLHPLAEERSQKFLTPIAVNDVAFSPDGHTLAAVGDAHVPRGVWDPAPEATVHLWDLETGKETTWEGHVNDIHGLAFSPTAPLLATCAEDGTVRLWDRTGSIPGVRTIGPGPFGGSVRAVALTPDGRYLVTANGNGTVYALRLGAPR
jgi:DNA-binding beta-propeller fold protein YncE